MRNPFLKQLQQSQYQFSTGFSLELKTLLFFVLFILSIPAYANERDSEQEETLNSSSSASAQTNKTVTKQQVQLVANDSPAQDTNDKESKTNSVSIEIDTTQQTRVPSTSSSFYEDFKRQQELTLKRTQKAADTTQENVSIRLHKFSSYVDKFFADENYVQESYDSRLRFSLRNKYQKYSTPTLKPGLNLSLALPNTKNRWRLRFASDSNNEDSSNATNQNSINDETVVTDNTFSTALGLTLKQSKLIDIRTNIGIKFHTPIDPFTRLRLRRSFLFENIELRTTETFEWLDSIGKTATSQLDIEYPLTKNYFFRSRSKATYWDINSYWSGYQSLTLYDQLSPKSLIAYAVGVNAQNEDTFHLRKKDQVNAYWIETRYRKRFYKTWLFYQVSPGLIRPREYNFETLPRLELRLEAVYGKLSKKNQ